MNEAGRAGAQVTPVGDAPTAPTFEGLYRSQWARMVRLAWLLSADRSVAEDIVHDAFLRLEPRWRQIDDREAYLRKCVINAVRSHHRRRAVERRHLPAPPGPAFNPEVDETWRALLGLPARERHALVLRFYLDLSIKDVARQLQCAEGTAKSLVHRGIAHLRERIEHAD